MAQRPYQEGPSADDPSVHRLWPTETGAGVLGPYPEDADGTKRSDDHELGVRCYQCGYPIADARKAAKCPFCGSDNYEGQILEP